MKLLENNAYVFLHGLLGTNIDWQNELKKSLDGKGEIFTPSIDYFQSPEVVRSHISKCVCDILNSKKAENYILIANSVGCHFGLDFIDDFKQCFFISPTYEFERGSILRSQESIREEVRNLFFDKAILHDNAEVLEQETAYISERLKELPSIRSLRRLKKELVNANFASIYKMNKNKIHIVLGENDELIPVSKYVSRQKELGVSIDIIKNCSHVAPVEKPEDLRNIFNKYGV